jgi:hypothetical protein
VVFNNWKFDPIVVAASVLHFVEQFLRKPMQENLQMELTREGRLRTATMKISIDVGCFEGRKTGCGIKLCTLWPRQWDFNGVSTGL